MPDTVLTERDRKRIALQERADEALKSADAAELHKVFVAASEETKEMEMIMCKTMEIAFSKGSVATEAVAIQAMRDVALAAIELARAYAKP